MRPGWVAPTGLESFWAGACLPDRRFYAVRGDQGTAGPPRGVLATYLTPGTYWQGEHAAGGNSGEECLGVVCVTQGSLSQLNDDGARDCATLTSRLRNPFSRADCPLSIHMGVPPSV